MKSNKLISMALAFAAFLDGKSNDKLDGNIRRERNPNSKRTIEPQPQKGQFTCWFKEDGIFLNEKQPERMLKSECVFKCFAINDKNAIKKYNAFVKANQ
jgi:hypothetical protein